MTIPIGSIVTLLMLISGGAALAVEEPQYQILRKYDDFEVRKYPSLLVAETEVVGSFTQVGNQSFQILFAYISGENNGRSKIDMTAPVIQNSSVSSRGEKIATTNAVLQETDRSDTDESYTIAFVMPSNYTLDTLPIPNDPRVKIRQIPERVMAVRRYSGSWDQKRYEDQEKKLMDAIQKEGFTFCGNPVFARYNPPFMPSFLRRNEVMLEIKDWKEHLEKIPEHEDQAE